MKPLPLPRLARAAVIGALAILALPGCDGGAIGAPTDTAIGADVDAPDAAGCQPVVTLACCAGSVCVDDGCGRITAIAACDHGCEAGVCAPCAATCDDRACGDDGCGGSCGGCDEGERCVDGRCACDGEARAVCCDGGLCVEDACGVIGPPIAACPGGCEAGACAPCVGSCEGRACGDDGCGGSCGDCEGGRLCVDGDCACAPTPLTVCCDDGAAVCAADSCGAAGGAIAACPDGCAGGACLPCVPDCAGRVCGDDGCGGACGLPCEQGATCVDGRCECPPGDAVCCGDAVCARDSCGVVGAVVVECPHGCVDARCETCEADCDGRICGGDGCGGVCGDGCPSGQACDELAGACGFAVRVRLLYEGRRPLADASALGPVQTLPIAGLPVVVADSAGAPLAEAVTDADGWIDLRLDAPPSGGVRLIVTASLADDAGDAWLSVVDAAGVAFPSSSGQAVVAQRVWAWAFDVPAVAVDGGAVTMTLADGAGALQLLLWARDQLERVRVRFPDVEAPSLAILWSPAVVPVCLSCYFPRHWGPLTLAPGDALSPRWGRFVWLSGANGTFHHFTPSMVAHEVGHFIMDAYSREVGEGGAHAWNSRATPGLAWSEGWATFFAQAWLSEVDGTERSRFFTMQQGTQYWIDIDAIGVGATQDDASLALTFPLPRPDQDIEQSINEAVISAILWDLWDASVRAGEADALALGEGVWPPFVAAELVDPALDRGYSTPDLVDFLDALRCADAVTFEALRTVLIGFPYDDDPVCADP